MPTRVDFTKEELLDICERAVVPEELWHDRDSCSAHQGIGMAWVFLKAGVPYKVLARGDLKTDSKTIWLEFYPRDFMTFEEGERLGREVVYLPTPSRLASAEGRDWY